MDAPPSKFSSVILVNETRDFDCPLCLHIFSDPVQCKDGHLFCRGCLNRALATKEECPICKKKLTPSDTSTNRFVKNAIQESEVYCFTRLEALEEVGVAAADSGNAKDSEEDIADHCTWTGKLLDAATHFNACDYAGIKCNFHDCGIIVMRKDMPEHKTSCPRRTQPCKWCQLMLLVDKHLIEHESICDKRDVECTHAQRGCKAVMPFNKRALHVANDCMYETVACPFLSVGCTERMMRKDIENHEEASMKQHNRMLLQDSMTRCRDIQALQRDNQSMKLKTAEHTESIQALQHNHHSMQQTTITQGESVDDHRLSIRAMQREIVELAGSNQLLQQKAAEHSKRTFLQNELPLYQMDHKVKVADLIEDGVVDTKSEDKMVGAYNAHLFVGKGSYLSGDCCGVFLRLTDGHFPCRLAHTIEVVHWDGKPASTRKGTSAHEFIPLHELTDTQSPYVKRGEVTFIATFRILSAEQELTTQASAPCDDPTYSSQYQLLSVKSVNQDVPLREIVFKVEMADLLANGMVCRYSPYPLWCGGYQASMNVGKGHVDNDDCCGAYLHLEDGPFPCHVFYTIEVVHWDGNSASVYKTEHTHIYENAGSWGWHKFIPLIKFTDDASPYVNKGHVTFIARFRIAS